MSDGSTMAVIKRREGRICGILTSHQMGHVCSSLLVPLMIAVFTIVTTVLQMNTAQKQRDQDLQIAEENREKDFQIANQTRLLQNEIEEYRRVAEANAQTDQQMNIILAAYLKDMAELMLFRNFSLTDHMIATVIRAKTFTTLGQLDGKRKGHLVRFLYEARMIRIEGPSIDLTDADLSNVDLTNYKLTNASFAKSNMAGALFRNSTLQNVSFANTHLDGASFDRSILTAISFCYANLAYTSFIKVQFDDVDFHYAVVTNADFTNIWAPSSIWFYANGDNAIFNKAILSTTNFSRVVLRNASFISSDLSAADIYYSTLFKTNFTEANLFLANCENSNFSGSIFDRSRISMTTFSHSFLAGTKWADTVTKNVDFSWANLSNASITDAQIQGAWKTFDIILTNGEKGVDSNLLENGGAENGTGHCETSPWYIDSMIAEKHKEPTRHIFGLCHFTRELYSSQGRMWQRVRIPSQYNEWIRKNMASLWITGQCVCNDNLTLHIRQFNGNNNASLVNNTHDSEIYVGGKDVLFPVHPATTEIELEIVFTGLCATNHSGSCDN